jgi:glycosyltransferase involved in cell wall biosynthesis
MKVSQILSAAGPVDAVTNQGLACRTLFERWGWGGSDYSPVIASGLQRNLLRPLREFKPADDEVVVLHYSGYVRGLERLLGTHRRSLLISHNITPARYFWPHEPVEGVRCELARGQLRDLSRTVGALAGVSEFNAQELRAMSGREANVIPVLFDRRALGAAPPNRDELPPTVLFVGRLTPHKRQDLVIQAFARYRRHRPDARLVLVGVPLSPEFEGHLRALADAQAPGAVSFESAITRERLAEHYRRASVFLCLSEHEGFCIPLLEAFHFGVPVIARNGSAVGEVVKDAGLLLGSEDNPQVVGEALRIVVGDPELRSELRARGERRLQEYELDRTAERLRTEITAVAA